MARLSLILVFALATAAAVVPRFFALGFTHIVPHGLDHVLFILALFFLSRRFEVLLFQMTLFTLAHSLTFALALYGIVSMPTGLVETAIALSIAFVAIENLCAARLSRWRPWLVTGFGLIHGLGFAHSFRGMALDRADFLPALFSFNVGIECGQLAVVALAYAAAIAWRRWVGADERFARTASLVIAFSGIFMAVERGL